MPKLTNYVMEKLLALNAICLQPGTKQPGIILLKLSLSGHNDLEMLDQEITNSYSF